MNIQPRDARICKDGRNGKLDLRDKLTVIAQCFCALNDAVLNKEPRNNADKHKGEEIERKRRLIHAVEVNVDGFERLDSHRKREPLNKHRERGLNNSPERTDNSALVGFDKLVLSEQQNLLAKPLVLL